MKNDYYVYGHYLKDNGILFYVGKGRRNRKLSNTGRSKEWKQITENNEWYACVIKDNLSETQALEFEKELISKESNLINRMLSTVTKNIPQEVLDYFYYDETSPSGLRWKKSIIGSNGRTYKAIGDVAGIQKDTSQGKDRRWIVKFLGNSFYAHRLVYSLHYSLNPLLVIDHIDGNPLNNKLSNLRAITQEINSRNAERRSSETSTNIIGVAKVKRSRLKCVQYVATWYENGKLKSKEFSNAKMTDEQAFQMACDFRANKIKELNEQGAGYTERHGT